MFNWLIDLFKGDKFPKKKSKKRAHGDFVKQLAHKAAKEIGSLTPLLLAGMTTDEEIVVLGYCHDIDLIKKTAENELGVRIAPGSRFDWARYFYVKYDPENHSLTITGVSDRAEGIMVVHNKRQNSGDSVEILQAALGEVIFEYAYGFADDLEAIASALVVADKIQRGVIKASTQKPTTTWIV